MMRSSRSVWLAATLAAALAMCVLAPVHAQDMSGHPCHGGFGHCVDAGQACGAPIVKDQQCESFGAKCCDSPSVCIEECRKYYGCPLDVHAPCSSQGKCVSSCSLWPSEILPCQSECFKQHGCSQDLTHFCLYRQQCLDKVCPGADHHTLTPMRQHNSTSAQQRSPADTLSLYYSLIDAHDYPKAYAMWEDPQQTLAQFAAGFAQTRNVYVTVTHVDPPQGAAGTVYDDVHVKVVATLYSGAQQKFSGFYTVSECDDVTGCKDIQWRIYSANIKPAAMDTHNAMHNTHRHGRVTQHALLGDCPSDCGTMKDKCLSGCGSNTTCYGDCESTYTACTGWCGDCPGCCDETYQSCVSDCQSECGSDQGCESQCVANTCAGPYGSCTAECATPPAPQPGGDPYPFCGGVARRTVLRD